MFIRAPYNSQHPIVLDMLAETARSFGVGPIYVDGFPDAYRKCGAGIYPVVAMPQHGRGVAVLSVSGVPIDDVVWPDGDDWVLAVGHDGPCPDRDTTGGLRVGIPVACNHPLWSPVALGIALYAIQKKTPTG